MTNFHFFWTSKSPFSQWHPANFKIQFNCAEQFMMYTKAMVFGNYDIAIKILESNDPREQKSLGRQVKNFDPELWDKISQNIVFMGNYFKFTQNNNLLVNLLDTDNQLLVEASPYDKIWGIGIDKDDPKINDTSNWGLNLLGRVLTNVRNYIKLKLKEKI